MLTKHLTTHMSPRPPSPPLLWAFAPYYARPLPPQLNFDPVTGFSNMVDAMEILGAHGNPPGTVRVNAAVATYKDGNQKQALMGGEGQAGDIQARWKRGSTFSYARKGWRTAGSVGVVVLGLTHASLESATGISEWHAVTMTRQGDQVWVHDAAFVASDHAGNAPRMDAVHGTFPVPRLVLGRPVVKKVWFQGPPVEYIQGPSKQGCIGRSVQWAQGCAGGVLPWPPNADASA
ncbi:hypothetical protein J1614_012206 [Plenodomus biglobosus]|nr:hypothetical protein J1614_012206 [Plenodomus biglobosus]